MKGKKIVANNGQKMALVYCRVSTKAQEDKSSLHTQADECIKHAESLGYQIGRVTKEVYSGAELWDRPMLAKDREDLRSGMFTALICYSTDRLARDPIHLSIIAQECERFNVELIFVTEPMDSSPEGMLIRYVKGYAAQIEREKIRERMMRGRRAKVQNGQPMFIGNGLFGYRADRDANQFVIYEPEARLVRRIFEMCIAGYGSSATARRLNDEKIPSPKSQSSVWKERKSHWCQATIYNILKNPSYKGEEYALKTKLVKGKEKKCPKSEWIKMPDGLRPAIVSPEIWQAAQETFKTNIGEKKRNEIKPILLRGFIFCADCNRRMQIREYSRYKKGRDVYRCMSRAKQYITDCKGETVPYEEINEWIWGEVKKILNNPTIIEDELKRLEKVDPNPQLKRDLESLTKELAKVERGLQALFRRFRDSADNKTLMPYIEREIGQAAKEKEQIEATIADLKTRIAKQSSVVDDLRSLKDYCQQVKGRLENFSFDDKRLAFKALGLKVIASGRDRSQWRYEVNIPIEKPKTMKSAAGAGGKGGQLYLRNQDSFRRRAYRKTWVDFSASVSLASSHNF